MRMNAKVKKLSDQKWMDLFLNDLYCIHRHNKKKQHSTTKTTTTINADANFDILNRTDKLTQSELIAHH